MIRITDIVVFTFIMTAIVVIGYILVFKEKIGRKQHEDIDFAGLLESVRTMLNDYVGFSEKHPGFTGIQAENADKSAAVIVNAIRECCSGNVGAREIVKELIEAYLTVELKLDDTDVKKALNEEEAVVVFYELMYVLEDEYGDYAFRKIWKDFLEKQVSDTGVIDAESIRLTASYYSINPDRKQRIKILSELLYVYAAGLGAVDVFNWQKGCIEEIQLGLSGVSGELYDYREEINRTGIYNAKECDHSSRDSVHLIIEGRLYKLSFISFGTDDELVRILRNLVRNSVSPELTRLNPMLVADAPDGRRISVSRPPLTEAWVGLIRKFDTVSQTTIDELVKEKNAAEIIKHIVTEEGTIAVTGEMASGKTTLLRAILLLIGEVNSIRVIEADSFELNLREYLPKANILTMRVSEEFTEDKVLAFAKKTTGQVFAIGEICSPYMANLAINVSKYAKKVLFTAHYKSTADMVSDFTSARINAGGWSDEKAAGTEALNALRYDVHVINVNGRRSIQYINEVMKDGSIKCLFGIR